VVVAVAAVAALVIRDLMAVQVVVAVAEYPVVALVA
jgi:hypothetical protein